MPSKNRTPDPIGATVFFDVLTNRYLGGSNVFSLRAFLAFSYSHCNFLTFVQRTTTIAIDRAEVNKDVLATGLLNEAKAFLVVKPLYGPFD